MAAGGIVNIEPVDTGGYRAQLADGTSLLLHGDSADALYERKKATGPDALAANDVAPGDTRTDAGWGIADKVKTAATTAALAAVPFVGPALAAANLAKPKSAPSVRQGTTTVEAPQAQPEQGQPATVPASAQATPQAAAAPADRPKPGMEKLGYAMKGIDPVTGKEVQGEAVRITREDGSTSTQIYIPGKAGSAGGLTALGKQENAANAATEIAVAGGRSKEEEASARGVDAAKMEAEERSAYLDEAKVQASLQMQQQQDEQAKIQQHVDELQGKYEKAREDFLTSKVDPDAYMKGGHGAVGIFSALSVALAQYGSAFTGQPNVAAQFVNNQIDRNIRAQETQIQIKGKAADNMLGDLTREMGNLNQAKLAMRQILTERAAIEAQAVGARYKGTQIQASADAVSAKLQQENALQDNARRRANLEHVMTNKMYYQQGSAGRPGGFAPVTQEAMGKNQDAEIASRKLALEEAKQRAANDGKDKVDRTGVAAIRSARLARGAAAEMADALGITMDENGVYQPPSGGNVLKAHIWKTDVKQKLDALKLTLASETAKAQTGASATDTEMKHMLDQIDSLNTPGDYAAFLNHTEHTMKNAEKTARDVAGSVHMVGGEDAAAQQQ